MNEDFVVLSCPNTQIITSFYKFFDQLMAGTTTKVNALEVINGDALSIEMDEYITLV